MEVSGAQFLFILVLLAGIVAIVCAVLISNSKNKQRQREAQAPVPHGAVAEPTSQKGNFAITASIPLIGFGILFLGLSIFSASQGGAAGGVFIVALILGLLGLVFLVIGKTAQGK